MKSPGNTFHIQLLSFNIVFVRFVHLQCRRPGFSPCIGKIPWRRKWQPIPVLLPGKSHGCRSLAGYSPWGRKESYTTERLHFLFFVRFIHIIVCSCKLFLFIPLWNVPQSIVYSVVSKLCERLCSEHLVYASWWLYVHISFGLLSRSGFLAY